MISALSCSGTIGRELPMISPDGPVAVDRDDQHVLQRAGGVKVEDMADVQNVETTVGEDKLFPGFPQAGPQPDDFI